MKLQQPRNYDFRVSQFDPPRSQSGNDRETTTKVATTVKRRLLHLAIIERQIITLTTTAKPQQLRVNSREMTTFAASCNDREMQRPRSDKFETAQLLQISCKILCRFMAVVVSSAFWKSLIGKIAITLARFRPSKACALTCRFLYLSSPHPSPSHPIGKSTPHHPPKPLPQGHQPQGPCHIKNTTVILIHYGGGKKIRRYGRVSETPCFPGGKSQGISTDCELLRW